MENLFRGQLNTKQGVAKSVGKAGLLSDVINNIFNAIQSEKETFVNRLGSKPYEILKCEGKYTDLPLLVGSINGQKLP